MEPRRVDQLLRALQLVHRPPQNNLIDRAARDEANDGHRLGLAEAVHARRRLSSEHSIEVVGEKLRSMMPWIKKNKLVDQSRN